LFVVNTDKHQLEEKEEMVPDVDDTDGLDPAAEFEAWRLRELGRIKKAKEDEVRREEEREEIERRRALPEEQRLKEDLEKAKKSREEKPKGQQKFLQKYWHKGAFRQVQLKFSFLFLPSNIEFSRMMKFLESTITRKQRSLWWTFRCFQKSCRSRISGNAVVQNTRIWLIKIPPSRPVALVELHPSRQEESHSKAVVVAFRAVGHI
jgi:hypothetical protein